MILAIDVDYREDKAFIAGVLFQNWNDTKAKKIVTTILESIEPYQSGQFYKRELPCILALLEKIKETKLDCIVVDSYVYLGENKKGLGAYLYEALDKKIPIIGVAKSPFRDAPLESNYIYRGKSKKPLYITSIGIDQEEAKKYILQMYGDFRIPMLLKETDRVCRSIK